MADPSRTLLEGTLLHGRYRVGRLLGVGGMGAVYEAMQEDLGRRVAIKVLLPETGHASDAFEPSEALRRFSREARAAAGLRHPNIVAVTDFSAGTAYEPAFLVMELLEGRSLERAIADEGRLPADRVEAIATQILSALEAAHAAGIVHRDIKPDNVFLVPVTGAAGGELVKVLDFGIAKRARGFGATSSGLTATGAVLGTPAYMSPEQARGRDVDARSDLYSVGALMYHALSGRTPFAAPSFNALLFAIAEGEPPPLSSLRSDVSAGLAQIVAHAMAKSTGDRYASAVAMRAAIAALANPSTLRSAAPAADPQLAYAPTFASEPPGPLPIGPSAAPAALDGVTQSSPPKPPLRLADTNTFSPASNTGREPSKTLKNKHRSAIAAATIAVASIAIVMGFALGRGHRPARGQGTTEVTSPVQTVAMSPSTSITPRAPSGPTGPLLSPSASSAPTVRPSAVVAIAPTSAVSSAPAPRAPTTRVSPPPSPAAPARTRTGGTNPYVSYIDTNTLYEIDVVRDAVNARLSPITACFVDAEYDAVDHQHVLYALTLDAAGAVLSIAPPGTDDRDLGLDSCVEAQLSAIVFGAPHSHEKRRIVVGFTARHE